MGGIVSTAQQVQENVPLKKFIGLESIDDNDPFWNNLLSFNLKVDEKDESSVSEFEETVSKMLFSLMYNTESTGNFASFIRVFLRRASELKVSEQCQNNIFLWQTANSLIILRYIFKFLTQRMNEQSFLKVFDTVVVEHSESDSSDEEGEAKEEEIEKSKLTTAEEFVTTLVVIITQLPISEHTMGIHIEAVKCLITLLSTKLYSERDVASTTPVIFNFFTTPSGSKLVAPLCKTLLNNYLTHNSEYVVPSQKEPESIVFGLAASMWSMVQMAAGLDEPAESNEPVMTLGNVSILLLLNLACYTPANRVNPFKEIIAEFQNSQEVSTLTSTSATFKIHYSSLYERLCATVSQEPPMLLLYIVLHRNSGFRNFVLSRINLETLVVPVLKILHESISSTSKSNSHHMYLALIVMLILSEDDFFCKIIHEMMIKDVQWIDMDTPIREISLGGLTALVFIRAIQKNAVKMRDRYLHTNCLAALSNMSACFKHLSPIVCQKLINLIEILSKRHKKIVEHMRVHTELDVTEGQQINFQEDITALEEGIRTLLEIINSTLTSSLRYNPHLVYTILYHRALFDGYRQHPMFQDLLANIAAVISHFSAKVVNVKAGDGPAMMEIIEKEVLVWPTDRLAKFPDLKFRYVEDENTVDFFVPYVWKLTVMYSFINFDEKQITIFH